MKSKTIYLLPERLKEIIADIANDVDSYCVKSEIAIGKTDKAVITICAYSIDEAEDNQVYDKHVCVEIEE